MRSHFLSVAIFAGLLAACSASEAQTPPRHDACEIVTDYVERFVGEAERFRTQNADAPQYIAVRTEPYQLRAIITKDGPVEAALPDAITDAADWRKITKLPEQSVLEACVDLGSSLSQQAVISDDARIGTLTTGDDWEAHVLSIAMPIFTKNGRHAVIFSSKGMGGLAVVGLLAVYSKTDDGEWLLVGEDTRWIS
ncbi:hypothetical protein K3165_00840 [Qipengyuania sp. 1XM1-15A]|uniref:hypothetical protein n=1 Tax=Qipengyuania xiamenensis TaxID=2867237 RepID=UPI001C879FBF|nr:hypothetical protein [Qipengyuania xiamenensis]MBX7531463.1 hypothetical protein [Qipengyuania xiamenensis]